MKQTITGRMLNQQWLSNLFSKIGAGASAA
jgi:hypothetical protein